MVPAPPLASPMSLCMGIPSGDYVFVYLAVAAVTLAIYLVQQAREQQRVAAEKGPGKGAAGGAAGLLGRLRGLKPGKPAGTVCPELEEGLLKAEGGEKGEVGPVTVSSERMAALCAAKGVERGLEAASLAVLLTLETRRRYGSPVIGVLGKGAAKAQAAAVEVELEESPVDFLKLLRAVDTALRSAGAAADAPEVVLAWDQEPAAAPAPGQWAMRTVEAPDAGHLAVWAPSGPEARSFKALFENCAADPACNVWEAQHLSEASLAEVAAWGKPKMDFSAYRDRAGQLRPIPQILADMRVDPAADAVAGDGFTTSYGQLWAFAEEVRRLVLATASPKGKRVVAVYMGRGEQIAPAFLGVLAAGYQVVPVDVHWPGDRAKMVVADAEACLVLVEPGSAAAWAALGVAEPSSLVVDARTLQAGPGAKPPAATLSPESPAIMLFTSGSTGKPKGIVLSHGYLTALIAGVADSKAMTSATRTLCYHSPTWMPFLDYLFCPLIKGGCCLYFPEDGTHVVKPTELKAFAQRHDATNAGFVPAMLDILLEEGLPKTMNGIGVGGAAVPAEICHRALAALPDGGTLYTGYSGTEQGDVTQIKMRASEDIERCTADKGIMGAGSPHAGQHLIILDQGFSPVGPGAVGEVTVAGPGLATGYLNLPEKTAEVFLPSCRAFPGAPRAARSGDLARWASAGNLKVVGRRDSMVKVRGARIELGEVESAVASHPAVKSVVVTVYEDKLVAYVVPAVPANLRDHCKERLVAYMVPHLFEGLEELPRLPNGKVNKKGLPTPQERSDGAETVMELDSLGQMRKFTRRAASEDRVLDNVRAILIGLVIQSHATPLRAGTPAMLDNSWHPLGAEWGPVQLLLLQVMRGGGWSSLAFLSGFDDTRAMRPYGLTYREPLFLMLWPLLGFNWTMWYLPAFVAMRALFCAAHWVGLEKISLFLSAQLWITVPAFVDFYVGWQPAYKGQAAICPEQCYCPWQDVPGLETVAQYSIGWWVEGVNNSMVGHALIFIPCYWIGFYTGGHIFKVLTKIADETNWFRRIVVAGSMLALYMLMFSAGQPLIEGFDDRCSSFYAADGSFVFKQVLKNCVYYAMNLSMSLTYVVFIAAAVPVHLKYLAKICFSSLIMSAFTPCLLDFPAMALELRKAFPSSISPGVEMAWVFAMPFLYELVIGAIMAAILPLVAKGCMRIPFTEIAKRVSATMFGKAPIQG